MTEQFAALLRKELEQDRKRYSDHLVHGAAPDFTGYKVLCARVEEIDRLIVRIKDLERKNLQQEGLIDD